MWLVFCSRIGAPEILALIIDFERHARTPPFAYFPAQATDKGLNIRKHNIVATKDAAQYARARKRYKYLTASRIARCACDATLLRPNSWHDLVGMTGRNSASTTIWVVPSRHHRFCIRFCSPTNAT